MFNNRLPEERNVEVEHTLSWATFCNTVIMLAGMKSSRTPLSNRQKIEKHNRNLNSQLHQVYRLLLRHSECHCRSFTSRAAIMTILQMYLPYGSPYILGNCPNWVGGEGRGGACMNLFCHFFNSYFSLNIPLPASWFASYFGNYTS